MKDLKSMPTEQLEREIGELAAHIHAATCRWLLLVAELDRREGWREWGCKSCAHWLSYRCGIAPGAAREQIRVARRLAELPSVCEAFGRGELSYSKVRAISRVASEECESELLQLARHATAAQLERLTRAYRGVLETQTERVNEVHRSRYLTWEWDVDGSLCFRGRLAAEDGALLVRSLEAARDDLRVSAETPEADDQDVSAETCRGGVTDPHAPGNADAIVSIAETALAAGSYERSSGGRYQVVVHIDSEVLTEDDAEGACELEGGPALAPETARRLACDAALVNIAERNGRPLSVGRKTRSIPPSISRALRSRDHCCQFPGCTQRRFVDAHHIHHWAHGGKTELSNLMLLCRHHHRLLHEGGYSVKRQAGRRPLFGRPDGRAIPHVPRTPRGEAEEICRSGPRVTEETCVARSAGQPLDLGGAVERLLGSDGLLTGVSAETPAVTSPAAA